MIIQTDVQQIALCLICINQHSYSHVVFKERQAAEGSDAACDTALTIETTKEMSSKPDSVRMLSDRIVLLDQHKILHHQ